LLTGAWISGEGIRLPPDPVSWAAVTYLAIVGSVVAFLVYFSLLKVWTATAVSFFGVFTPAIALLLGAAVLNERLTVWSVVGAALILGGVAAALTTSRAAAAQPART
jgi:drug/metabolite transporter (DMT)-like permease